MQNRNKDSKEIKKTILIEVMRLARLSLVLGLLLTPVASSLALYRAGHQDLAVSTQVYAQDEPAEEEGSQDIPPPPPITSRTTSPGSS